jgi:2-haloacid dehalogenase
VAGLDFSAFDVLTFDCYGTLIDWEAGLVAALRPVLDAHGIDADEEQLLESYGHHEAALEAGEYMRYREVLAGALRRMGPDFGFEPSDAEAERFADSVGDWPAFPDSSDALHRLHERFKLAPVTNCDEDLFARSAERLGVEFDWVVTAERARSYKPSENNFHVAFDVIGVPKERILHVAQSLFHDHATAQRLGMRSVWVDRRGGREGAGATPPVEASYDLRVPDMATLAEMAAGG